jgi:hypothetical protein
MKQYRLDDLVGLVDQIPPLMTGSKPQKAKGRTGSLPLRFAETRQQVGEIFNECLEAVSYSILGGEYILDAGTEEKLISLKKKLGAGVEELDILNEDAQEVSRILREEFFRPLNHIVKSYLSTIAKIQRKYTFDKRKSVLGFETMKPSLPWTKQSGKFQITKIIIRTIELDHLLSLDSGVIQELLEIRERLSSKRFNKGFHEAEIALEKCNFLIRKVVMRMDHKGEGYYFTSNLKQVPFELRSFETETKLQWDEDAAIYYELHRDWKQCLSSLLTNAREATFREKIFSIKSLRQAKDDGLSQEFASAITETKDIKGASFHHHAAQKLLQNYFINCQFSHVAAALSPEDFFGEIDELLGPVRHIQIETVVLNFHPFKKATRLALEHLEKIKPQNQDEIKQHKRNLKTAEKLLREYEDRLEWCKARQFSEFLLPPQECFIEIDGQKTFIASSMSLPIDYEKEKNHLARLRESLNLLINQEKVNQDLTELRNTASEAQSLLSKHEARIESSQLKMIELLGAFTALFTIVVTNFSFFSSEKYSANAIFPFLLCLALSSLSIMGFIILIARSKNTNRLFWGWLTAILIITGLAIFYTNNIISRPAQIEQTNTGGNAMPPPK